MKKDLLFYLEQESISIIRDSFAKAKNPVMLYSIGKDSSVMLHLARKAFYPLNIPFPLLHIDTKWKFKEMILFRDKIEKKYKLEIIVYTNSFGIQKKLNPFDHGSYYTEIMKTRALKSALDKYNFDLSFGGARRDEETSRAKERIISLREQGHVWNPKNQRPEIWNLFNFYKKQEQTIRVFPISNWTELDIWQYIKQENIEVVDLYFSKKRPVIKRDGMLIMKNDERLKIKKNEKIQNLEVRFRTLGCYPLTAGLLSKARNLDDIILETINTKTSERFGRLIDKENLSSMERKKKEGYF
jgi:sulfate adenylyltransferase subunit 2